MMVVEKKEQRRAAWVRMCRHALSRGRHSHRRDPRIVRDDASFFSWELADGAEGTLGEQIIDKSAGQVNSRRGRKERGCAFPFVEACSLVHRRRLLS